MRSSFVLSPSLIQELEAPLFGYEAVMRAISLSLDRDDKERELVSRFFAVGHGIALSSFALEKGFEKTFERIGDLKLDCPGVESVRLLAPPHSQYMSRFLARAIVDEVFPPRILQNPLLKTYGASVLRATEELLSLPHSLERMEHVWGAGAASLEELQVMKRLIRDAIEEYFMSHDVEEVGVTSGCDAVSSLRSGAARHVLHARVREEDGGDRDGRGCEAASAGGGAAEGGGVQGCRSASPARSGTQSSREESRPAAAGRSVREDDSEGNGRRSFVLICILACLWVRNGNDGELCEGVRYISNTINIYQQ